jgi:hypothetical protein
MVVGFALSSLAIAHDGQAAAQVSMSSTQRSGTFTEA